MSYNLVKWTTLCIALFLTTIAPAQKGQKKVSAEAQRELERGMTEEELRYLTIFDAREQALEDAFGTDIQNTSMLRIDSRGDAFEQVAVNVVKGTWIRDLKEPKCETFTENGETWMRCSVYGEARKIRKPNSPVNVLPLAGPEKKFRTTSFVNDQDFFMYFRAPVDGFVSVYLILQDEVQCLLPYEGMSESYMRVKADKEYILFTEKGAPEYFMWTKERLETNLLVTIFSPHPYDKPILENGGEAAPRQLSIRNFYFWLGTQNATFEELQVDNRVITISPN